MFNHHCSNYLCLCEIDVKTFFATKSVQLIHIYWSYQKILSPNHPPFGANVGNISYISIIMNTTSNTYIKEIQILNILLQGDKRFKWWDGRNKKKGGGGRVDRARPANDRHDTATECCNITSPVGLHNIFEQMAAKGHSNKHSSRYKEREEEK